MIKRQCEGCLELDGNCTCARGGFRGVAWTADEVMVFGSDIVYWQFNPNKPFHPMYRFSAVPIGGGASEPMTEMYSTKQAARVAGELT